MADQQISKGGNCVALTLSGTSNVTDQPMYGRVELTPTVDCYIRQGDAPVALSTGVDQFLAAGAIYTQSVHGKIAAITSGAAGTLHISPVG